MNVSPDCEPVPAIRLHDVTVSYDRHPAVHHVSGVFNQGSLTAIVGPNGAGKSTLLKALMREGGQRIEGRIDRGGLSSRDFGYLPQAAAIDRRFPLTVADVVLLGGWHVFGAFGGMTRVLADQARQALAIVGLEGLERRRIETLSSGQFQRVLFARLILQNAKVILLDEPFTAIDARTVHDLLAIVLRWHEEGRTVIAVLHDFEQVRAYFPSTLLLARRVIAWGCTQTALTDARLREAHALAQGWDERAGICEKTPLRSVA
ncbi:MAG: ABC transporter ATP-binding protein [Castellaniella sp.]|nr:ABC transporter ATP-binding protein [Castellaniella sp.]